MTSKRAINPQSFAPDTLLDTLKPQVEISQHLK